MDQGENPQHGAVKTLKNQGTQTEEIKYESRLFSFDSSQIGDEPRDFLKLNEEGHHQIAYDYIINLQAEYSKEDLIRVYEKIGKLRDYLFAVIYGEDFSMSYEERARASIVEIYAEMASVDDDGLVLLSYLEVFYKRYRREADKIYANELFQELLALASEKMKHPELLKQLYNFPKDK